MIFVNDLIYYNWLSEKWGSYILVYKLGKDFADVSQIYTDKIPMEVKRTRTH